MSKDAPEVKPLPGVMRVPQSSKWQYWKRNPDTLLDHPAINGKQWAFRGSLGTSDLREANRLAAVKLAELETLWATMRAGQKPTAVLDVTPAMGEAIAQRLYASLLAEDEALRRDPGALAKSLAYWWQAQEKARKAAHERANRAAKRAEDDTPFRPGKMPKWLSEEEHEEIQVYVKAGQAGVPLGDLLELLRERHQGAAKQARQVLAKGNTGPFLTRAEAEAMALGVNLGADGWLSPEAQALRDTCQKAYLKALDDLAQRDDGGVVDTPVKLKRGAIKGANGSSENAEGEGAGLTLASVIESVLKAMPENDYKRKMNMVLNLVPQVMNPKMPVKDLKQAHISDFLAQICKLPTNWYFRHKKGESIQHLLSTTHPECISPKTYTNTYRSCVSTFLKRAQHEFHDQGFPAGLGVAYADYKGTRDDGDEQQRNFKPSELKRIFESQEYEALALLPSSAHHYWFPLVMLYTGARPREVCQMNPQVDFGYEDGVPYFLVSQKTAADVGVIKKVKTGEERKVPIHPELVRLGFIEHIARVKEQGAKRLFPGFAIKNGDAGEQARYWFARFLDELGLRDETPGKKVSGIYAFKKTFITEADRLGLRFEPITGHTEGERSKVIRESYVMAEIPVKDKLAVIAKVRFEVSPARLAY
jgi:integrase